MNHFDVVPIYAELVGINDYCEQAESVAEVHGVLSGLLCRDPFIGPSQWVNVLELEGEPGDQRFQMARGQLEELATYSARMLNEIDTEFQPMLPDDDEALSVRIGEFANWCQGFLYGFSSYQKRTEQEPVYDYEDDDEDDLDKIREKAAQAAAVELKTELAKFDSDDSEVEDEFPETVEEIIRDLTELSRAQHQVDDADESDEAAFMELLEYLRVSVQLVFEEMAGQQLHGRQEKIEVDPMYQFNNDNEIVH